MNDFFSLEDMVLATAEAVRPPERLSVAEAAEKYRYINNPGSYVGKFKNSVTPYLVEPMETLTSLDFTGMIFAGPAQCGKALSLDTPVPTPSGWTTMGEIQIGDKIYGADGSPTRVLAATEVMYGHDCFRVEFDDGTSITADADHKWAVEDRRGTGGKNSKPKQRVLTTREMVDLGVRFREGERARFRVPNTAPLQAPDAPLPIDPYLFGAWLGDGSKSSGHIAVAPEDLDHLLGEFRSAGFEPTVYRAPKDERDISVTAPGWPRALRDYGFLKQYVEDKKYSVADKFIPDEYMRASEAQRRDLIRGLMDTDGGTSTARPRRVDFIQKCPRVAAQTVEILRSLGIKPRVSLKFVNLEGKRHGPYCRVMFSVADPSDVFRMERKAVSNTRQVARPTQTTQRSITKVVPVKSVPVRCIRVDAKDHLFLAGEGMIPTHNSDMSLNYLTYTSVCDPADFMHIDKAQASARDFYQRRVEKLFRDTEAVRSRLMPGKHHQSTYSTRFTSGMLYTLSWPTVNELSGKPVGRMWLADYDRMEEDIGGEGSAYDLAVQRAKTFGRRGMTAAESSPSRVTQNPRWMPKTPHEAPPTTGILALYNRGDRRRWFWPCLSCGTPFEPDFSLFDYPDCGDDLLASAEQVVMKCPHCSHAYRDQSHEASGTPGKRAMNQRGFWMKDGQRFDPETGEIVGDPIRSRTASFWLKGPAAAFADWSDMTLKYLKARQEFENTGSEEALKTTINTDQGLPYLPAGTEAERLPEEMKARADEALGEKIVPEGVRFLIITVDTQKRRFEVQVHGIKEHGDVVVIDRFRIRKSARLDDDGDPLPLNPGSWVEDWHLLIDQALLKTYPLADGSGRHMQARMMAVDSGGADDTTANAYAFWRQLRDDPDGRNLHRRVQLLKGVPQPSAPLVRIDYPDAERKDRKAQARGEIPVLMPNTNKVKDMVNHMLGRTEPGGGFVEFPAWLPDWWFSELCAEVKGPKGWTNPAKARNEAWDLLCYCMALCHSSKIRMQHIDWSDPPGWAADWDDNDMVFKGSNLRFENHLKSDYDLKSLAEKLG